jgi:hypothetical protein
MTIQTNGAAYKNDYIGRFTVRDGKIVRFAEYYDPVRLVIALGGSVNQATLEGSVSESSARRQCMAAGPAVVIE